MKKHKTPASRKDKLVFFLVPACSNFNLSDLHKIVNHTEKGAQEKVTLQNSPSQEKLNFSIF